MAGEPSSPDMAEQEMDLGQPVVTPVAAIGKGLSGALGLDCCGGVVIGEHSQVATTQCQSGHAARCIRLCKESFRGLVRLCGARDVQAGATIFSRLPYP